MLELLLTVLENARDHAPVVVAVILLASAAESLPGVGAVVPGETTVVLGATALAGTPWLVGAVVAAWVGAGIADHLGYLLGQRLGPRTVDTRVVRWIGVHRWEAALRLVERHWWGMIGARLLPAVRTLVAPAAGASRLGHARFAAASALATLAWSVLWVLGGSVTGATLLAASDVVVRALPVLVAVVVVGALLHRRRARVR